jgi:Methyltransferase domain
LKEFDAFAGYPEPKEPRVVSATLRTIHNRIAASYRDKEFYEGARANGYGGMKDDGRWAPIARFLVEHYGLKEGDWALQVNAHKGYLLNELRQQGLQVRGAEPSEYAAGWCMWTLRAPFTRLPYGDAMFDLVIAASAVYAGNLQDAIRCLREIERVKKPGGHSWITLAAYEDENDFTGLRLLRYWFLTGTLILTKADWLVVMEHAGYRGDYRFDTAKSLNLMEDHGR